LDKITHTEDCDHLECLFQEVIKYCRYAAVGRRVTGIIHNINTPLQIILTQSELMERKLKEEQENFAPKLPTALCPEWQIAFDYRQKKNKQLQEVAYNLQHLVHWLTHRTFHENHHGIQEIDLNELLVDELSGYQAEGFYKHRVVKNFQWLDRLPPIAGFYVDFSQSICNLIDNALEALRAAVDPILSLTTRMDSGCRNIIVEDNGPGIPDEIQAKIFQPFFSTKNSPENPRAGLGLFLAQRLLMPYGGKISCESLPGQTKFQIVLP
jgi:two-component system, NtrC family, sensor kinase